MFFWLWFGTFLGAFAEGEELITPLIAILSIPFLIWAFSLILILINHINYNLNYFYLIITYYIYSSLITLPAFINTLSPEGYRADGPPNAMVYFAFPIRFERGTKIFLIEFLLSIIILTIAIILKKKMAPKYQKEQTAYIDKSGKRRMKLMIKFND